MHAPNRRWRPAVVVVVSVAFAGWSAAPSLTDEKKEKPRVEKVTLQYRVAKDAFAPSKFVAVINGGISTPLNVTWDLPKLDDKEKKAAQDKQKKEFDDLIKKLEDNLINGVEFDCEGEWQQKGFKLRITSVPKLTEAGTKRIKDNER